MRLARYWIHCLEIGLLVIAWAGCARPERKDEAATARSSGKQVFFVATNGSDGWSGRLARPNWRRSDGPFATLPRAIAAVRETKREGKGRSGTGATIFVREGHYFLKEPLILKPEDSDLALAAYKTERPVLSSGRPIRDWKGVTLGGKRMWAAEIRGMGEGEWFFHQLWVNGKRAVRARHPNHSYLSIAEVPDKTSDWTQGHTRFRFREGDFKGWKSVTNAEVVAMARWVESRLPIISVDETQRIVSFGRRSVFELAAGDVYYAEGALDFLDEPGEWCLDATAGTVYYLPRPGERIGEVEAIAPVLSQVLRLEGRLETNQFIERVTFRGLTFMHTEWYFPAGFRGGKGKPQTTPAPAIEVGGFAQAAVGVPGAVWGEGVRNCSFQDCVFGQIGNYGLELARGCQRNRIIGCEFSDLGAGGIKIGEGVIRESFAEQTRGNEIMDCHIHDGGKLFASGEGIWIGQSPDNRITHNLIHDFYYTGISIGWTWGYKPALATNNLVQFNHVHHIGVKSDGDGPILSDMGGIYTLGRQPGTKILNNIWHDIAGARYGGWGIYFDEGSSGILAQSNLVYRTTHGGFHQHYGETNVVRNNIFAFGRDNQIQRTLPEAHSSFSFETNVVYFDSGPLLAGDWSNENYQMDWNVYFDARTNSTPEGLRLGPCSLEAWRDRGHDKNSMVSDPLFVAAREDDYRLKSDSPALKMGFEPIDLRNVGPQLPSR
jgi:hypothetical protein